MKARTLITFVDVLFVLLLVLLRMDHNPAEEAEDIPGNIAVMIYWPPEIDADVDLWVQAPGDTPVGYSNKGGAVFNLLRDDLGHRRDYTNENSEIVFSRGAPNGEYTINLHLYRNSSNVYPVPVTVILSKQTGPSRTNFYHQVARLDAVKQELTVIRFTYKDGSIYDMHDVPKALRPAGK